MSKLEQIHVSSSRVRFETRANFFVRAQLANSRTSSSSTSRRLDKLNRFVNNILYLKFDQSIEWLANGTLLLHDAAQSSIYSLNTTLTLCHCEVVLKTLPFAAACRAPKLKMGYTQLAKPKRLFPPKIIGSYCIIFLWKRDWLVSYQMEVKRGFLPWLEIHGLT
jgi:hypothetical protein